MTSRFFNNIFYLEENKTILKSSTDFKKIQSEYSTFIRIYQII